ncbi:FUSC family protein [Streptomyces sp. TRM66268-LWL]|uniref:FUSC family protein n=1 Tax=Streptomyces polyasparticus TaxID=2767826 RepID=A0ABR7SQW1_9ACTN|nr:FUSC family protein [Streptomyces polyasparticus]MBC9717886.1 FUSC family protein [Streptomyces polyasparticus]
MSWLKALKETTRSGLKVERSRLEPLFALRATAGLALVVCSSFALMGPEAAVSSAFGALQAAIATFQRSWRPRPVLALASGTTLAITTFLGYLAGAHLVLFIALLALWTFLAGLTWALGPTVGVIASSNVAMVLVTVTLPTTVAEAAGHAAVIFLGGLVQAALIVLFPIRRWGAQRDALADALAAEADYARRLRHDPTAAFDPAPLMAAREAAVVTARQARTRPSELHGARGLAERIRPVLASLADPAVGAADEGPERDRVRELLAAAGAILDAAARAIRHGEPVALPPGAVAALRTPDTGAILTGPAYRASRRLAALLDDVVETATPDTAAAVPKTVLARLALVVRRRSPEGRAASRHLKQAAEAQAPEGTVGGAPAGARAAAHAPAAAQPPAAVLSDTRPIPLLRPSVPALGPRAARTLRDELKVSGSPYLRHAIRVTAVVVIGYVTGHNLPFGHGYWAPLASVMVMRPDFSQTYGRAVARFGGTLVGVSLASVVVFAAEPGQRLSLALAIVCAGLMYLLLRTGYVVVQVLIAAYIVFLLGAIGADVGQTVYERVLLTLLGGLLAMISYAVYPAWETPRLRTKLADWLVADGRYAAAVIEQYAAPSGQGEVRQALLDSRAARIAWREALQRAAIEPVRHRGLSHAAADGAGEALAQIARIGMLMEAHVPERGTTPVPAAAQLADALRESADQGAKAVRERRVPDWRPVRECLENWDGEGVPDRVVLRGARLLLDALDELSDALEPAPPR